jgi:hypothetical protein
VKVQRVPLDGPGKPLIVPVLDADVASTPGAPSGPSLREGTAERRLRASPTLAGLYELELDGDRTTRVAGIPDREIDLRPRRTRDEARSAALGGVDPSLDVSPHVALVLLGLFAVELVLRVLGQRADRREAA